MERGENMKKIEKRMRTGLNNIERYTCSECLPMPICKCTGIEHYWSTVQNDTLIQEENKSYRRG